MTERAFLNQWHSEFKFQGEPAMSRDRKITDQSLEDAAPLLMALSQIPEDRRLDALAVVSKVLIEEPWLIGEWNRRRRILDGNP